MEEKEKERRDGGGGGVVVLDSLVKSELGNLAAFFFLHFSSLGIVLYTYTLSSVVFVGIGPEILFL